MKKTYQYTYRNTPGDYWRFYMASTYHSLAGVVNVIFTIAIAALIISRWSSSELFFKGVMIFALLIFPVFQPIAVYGRAIRESESLRAETTLVFDDRGMEVRVRPLGAENSAPWHQQSFGWKQMSRVLSRLSFLMVFPDDVHGYLLADRILGDERKELEAYIKQRLAS